MSLPQLAVKRPVTIVMLVLIVLLLGFVSFNHLYMELLPDLEIPVATVITDYTGAGPQEIENLVTRPIEEVLSTVGSIESVISRSERDQSLVIIQFDWGTDMDFALLEVREKIDIIKPYLPEDAKTPRVFRFNPNAFPIVEIGLFGDLPSHELRHIAETQIKNRLERIDGVASVEVVGGREREIHVRLDPGKMQAYNIGLDRVVQALAAANLNLTGGQVQQGSREYLVRIEGLYNSVSEIEDVVIMASAAGVRRIKDIATVEDSFKQVKELSRVNGRENVSLLINKEARANTVDVARKVQEAVASLQDMYAGQCQLSIVTDNSVFIEMSVDTVTSNAVVGGILAVLVLLLFLRNIGTTLIISVAIPISIIATFTLIYFNNMTLNLMSLGGLALGIGMLVDNAIVVIENIYRHVSEDSTPRVAAVKGTEQVSMAITASTLTTLAVFLPVVFIKGIASEIFTDLSLTITFSLASSLLVSLTLVPMLASRLLRTTPHTDKAGGFWSIITGFLPRVIKVGSEKYARSLERLLKRRWMVVSIAVVLLLVSLGVFRTIGREFLPQMDEGTVLLQIQMPKGTTLEETNLVVMELERDLMNLEYITTVFAQVGSNVGGDNAKISAQLVPHDKRKITTAMAMEDIRLIAKDYPQAEITVAGVPVFGDMGIGETPFKVNLQGDDLDQLEDYALVLAEHLQEIRGLRDIRTSIEEPRIEAQVQVKRDKASTYGLSIYQIAASIRTAIHGQVATRYRSDGREIDVLVKLEDQPELGLGAIGNVPISTPLGTTVLLKEVADMNMVESVDRIDRQDQSRQISVQAQVANRSLSNIVAEAEKIIAELELPNEIDVVFGGDTQWMNEALGDLAKSLVLAVCLVYMIIASQFESLWQPLVILLSIPFAFVGVAWALFLTGKTINISSMIGVILLAGIVVNNGIVLIDYINQLRQEGHTREAAVILAGKTRLRPILMTTLTTVLGLLPLAVKTGAGGELESPMAIVAIGGLTVSTLLTLFLIPTMYTIMDDFVHNLVGLFPTRNKETISKEVHS